MPFLPPNQQRQSTEGKQQNFERNKNKNQLIFQTGKNCPRWTIEVGLTALPRWTPTLPYGLGRRGARRPLGSESIIILFHRTRSTVKIKASVYYN